MRLTGRTVKDQTLNTLWNSRMQSNSHAVSRRTTPAKTRQRMVCSRSKGRTERNPQTVFMQVLWNMLGWDQGCVGWLNTAKDTQALLT